MPIVVKLDCCTLSPGLFCHHKLSGELRMRGRWVKAKLTTPPLYLLFVPASLKVRKQVIPHFCLIFEKTMLYCGKRYFEALGR